jgi:alkylation response protein AidB-like acyl-CoA dehydrogenase
MAGVTLEQEPDSSQPPVSFVMTTPRDRVELIRNWDTIGLRGTSSWDYVVPSQHVRSGYTFARNASNPLRGGPSGGFGVVGIAEAGHTAIVLGMMGRALGELAKSVEGKVRPGYATTIDRDSAFLRSFGELDAQYNAARTWTYAVCEEMLGRLKAGETLQPRDFDRLKQVAAFVQRTGTSVASACFQWAGQSALRNPSLLGRCLRDMLAAGQHVFVDPIHLVTRATSLLPEWRNA